MAIERKNISKKSKGNGKVSTKSDQGTHEQDLVKDLRDLSYPDTPDELDFRVQLKPVYITQRAMQKICIAMEVVPRNEWSMVGHFEEGQNLVHDLVFPEQEGSYSTVDIFQDPDAEDEEDVTGLDVYIHSHHSMGATFSGTDHEGVNSNFDVSILVAWINSPKYNDDDYTCRPRNLDFTVSRRVRIEGEWYKGETGLEIVSDRPDMEAFREQVDENWSRQSYYGGGTKKSHSTTRTGGRRSYGGHGNGTRNRKPYKKLQDKAEQVYDDVDFEPSREYGIQNFDYMKLPNDDVPLPSLFQPTDLPLCSLLTHWRLQDRLEIEEENWVFTTGDLFRIRGLNAGLKSGHLDHVTFGDEEPQIKLQQNTYRRRLNVPLSDMTKYFRPEWKKNIVGLRVKPETLDEDDDEAENGYVPAFCYDLQNGQFKFVIHWNGEARKVQLQQNMSGKVKPLVVCPTIMENEGGD